MDSWEDLLTPTKREHMVEHAAQRVLPIIVSVAALGVIIYCLLEVFT